MEEFLYTINLVIHILAAVGCAAGPYYQLRMVKLRGKQGTGNLIHPLDEMVEEILSFQPRLCLALILVLIGSGFAFPAIEYAFHGHLPRATVADYWVGGLKTLLALTGLAIVVYGVRVVDPQIQGLFAGFAPDREPPAEELARFWELRRLRRSLCRVCLGLAVAILVITPVMRFF